MSQISDVYAFNVAARGRLVDGQLVVNWPLLKQADKHLSEELTELRDAMHLLEHRLPTADSDEGAVLFKDVADAACDLAWISFNVLYCLGITRPEEFWRTVKRANMAKIPNCTECQGEGAVPDAANEEFVDCGYCQGSGYGPPALNEDQKILKPEGWKGPDLEQLRIIKDMARW